MTEDEISPLWAASDGMVRPHPLCELLANSEDPPPISLATIRSLRLASKSEPLWMKRLRARLLDAADFTNAGAALGEIRAYGAMTFAGLKPKPIDQGDNPDFRVEVGEKAIIVEVHTKQMDYTQQAKLGAWLDARKHSVPPPGVSVETSPSIAPFGEPDRSKPGDTVVANMISRLAGIKAREHQLHEGLANVLWLDLCSSPLGMLIDTGHALPFMSRMGRISSGALWYAAYGRRGLPIIEGRAHAHHVVVPMGHDGKFVGRSTKISGLIASCIDGFVLLENPSPIVGLPPAFRNALLTHMAFKSEQSVCAWGDDAEIVPRTLAAQELALQAIDQTLKQHPFLYQGSYGSPTLIPWLEAQC